MYTYKMKGMCFSGVAIAYGMYTGHSVGTCIAYMGSLQTSPLTLWLC